MPCLRVAWGTLMLHRDPCRIVRHREPWCIVQELFLSTNAAEEFSQDDLVRHYRKYAKAKPCPSVSSFPAFPCVTLYCPTFFRSGRWT